MLIEMKYASATSRPSHMWPENTADADIEPISSQEAAAAIIKSRSSGRW